MFIYPYVHVHTCIIQPENRVDSIFTWSKVFNMYWNPIITNNYHRKELNGFNLSAYGCLSGLVRITQHQSRDHNLLADLFSDSMHSRLTDVIDDHRRMFNKVCAPPSKYMITGYQVCCYTHSMMHIVLTSMLTALILYLLLQSKEVALLAQGELFKVLNELQSVSDPISGYYLFRCCHTIV